MDQAHPLLSRRQLLAVGAGLAISPQANAALNTEGLGALAQKAGLLFGSAFDRPALENSALQHLIRHETQITTLENALKFDWLRPHGAQADFTIADQLVNFALAHGGALRGHALVWNDNLPAWLKSLSVPQLRAMMAAHIEEVAGRYAGRLHSWDVVNEPFSPWDRQDGHWRKGAWFSAFGEDYVAQAFRRAKAADPNARLVLNEAFCEQNDAIGQAVRPALLRLVRTLKHQGVPLDAVGFQAHLKPHLPYDDGQFAEYLAQIAQEGVDIYITELDVDDSAYPASIPERDAAVSARYEAFLSAVLAVPAVKLVMTWGLDDAHSWYMDLARQRSLKTTKWPRPLLYDAKLQPKPARMAVARAFQQASKHRITP